MGLIKDIKDIEVSYIENHIKRLTDKYNITKDDLVGEIKNVPLRVIILALEEQERQHGVIDLSSIRYGVEFMIEWCKSRDGWHFWHRISNGNYDEFYLRYPEYKTFE